MKYLLCHYASKAQSKKPKYNSITAQVKKHGNNTPK